MAQHDYNIANQSGADFRADLNNALGAIATTNSGATEPSTTYAHQLWVDTSSNVLKIRNGTDSAWITTGISITTSNILTGDLTGNVTGNLTGNVTGNVTGDLTGNADTATTLATARTISLSGDVAGSASFDGSGDITITTTAQIDSIALGTDTTGDYVQSISGGTGVTVTGGTGEGSTPSVAIGQAVATTDNVTFNLVTATDEFVGDIDGGVRFSAKADGALSKGDVVYISGVTGNTPTVAQAKADDTSKMPAFGFALSDANDNAALQVVTFGTLEGLDTSGVSVGQVLYVSTTAGAYTTTKPTGESSQIQNIGKVQRSHASVGSIKVGGAGRSNDVPNLNNGKIFIGNASNQAVTSTLDTSIVVENTNLYFTNARVESYLDAGTSTPTFASAVINSSLTGSAILDDDTFGTASATTVATSESIKAYVDSQVGTVDTLSEILANGNTTGGNNILFADNDKAIFGAGSDLEIYHDGNHSRIVESGGGDMIIQGDEFSLMNVAGTEYMIFADNNSFVKLYYDGSNKLATTSTGIDVTGVITTDGLTTTGNINLGDNKKAIFGDSSDLQIYHDGSNSYIQDLGTGNLYLTTDGSTMNLQAGSDNMVKIYKDAQVEIFHDASVKLATTATGIDVTGAITTDGLTTSADINFGDDDKAVFGAGSDLQIYHTSADNSSYIRELGAGNLKILGDNVQILNAAGTENQIFSASDGGVYLYHNGVAKFETTSSGIDVTGTVTSDELTVNGNINKNSNYNITQFYKADGSTRLAYILFRDDSPNYFEYNDTDTQPLYFINNNKKVLGLESNSDISFYNTAGTSQALFFDASTERLGIGTTSPNTNLHVYDASGGATLKIESNTANAYDSSKIQLLGGNLSTSEILLGDASSATTGRIIYRHDGNTLAFDVNGSEAGRFTSTGTFLVGKTADNTTDIGSVVGDGYIYATRSGNIPLVLNRTTSDGTITQFRKDNSTYGSISNSGTNLIISGSGTNKSGLYYGDNALFPVKNGSLSNSTIGFGSPNYRFTDLYLSGSAYLADNGKAILGSGDDLQLFHNGANSFITNDTGYMAVKTQVNNGSLFLHGDNVHLRTYQDNQPMLTAARGGAVQLYHNNSKKFETTSSGITVHSNGNETYSVTIVSSGAYTQSYNQTTSAFEDLYTSSLNKIFKTGSSPTEALRIDSSQNVLIGTTDTFPGAGDTNTGISLLPSGSAAFSRDGFRVVSMNRNTSDGDILEFRKNGTTVGSVSVTSSATTYNTSSDARLKDVTGQARGLDVINALNPVSYNWKADGRADEGLIAQEVLDLVPNAVSQNEDEYYQMDYSKLVTPLIKAVQELSNEVNELKQEVQNLKGE